jgi:regulator of cell morphogenesis and NO signaling
MDTFQIENTVGEVVRSRPALSRVFEEEGIDYCCGGKKSLLEVCRDKGLDPQSLLTKLQQFEEKPRQRAVIDPETLSLAELVNHIEETHHTYLRTELPRIDKITKKVASVHGEKDSRLEQVRQTFLELSAEISSHMMKEEQVLFPLVRQLEASDEAPVFHCGSLANPIRQMEVEHDGAGGALKSLRSLTDGYEPPEWACNTYRAMLDALVQLETDLHQHIHKENNVLFPRVLEKEAKLADE